MHARYDGRFNKYVQKTTRKNISKYKKEFSSKIAKVRRKNKLMRCKWTKKEVTFLKNLAKNERAIDNAAEFARKYYVFFPKRSVGGIKNKIYHLGLYINPNK